MEKKLWIGIAILLVAGIASQASAVLTTVDVTVDPQGTGAGVWQLYTNDDGTSWPADGQNFTLTENGVDGPGGGNCASVLFGDSTLSYGAWIRIYNDGSTQIWTLDDSAYWSDVHTDPGQTCPYGSDSDGIANQWWDYHPHEHPGHLGYDGVVLGPEYGAYEGAIIYAGGEVPEPITMSLLGLGGLALLRRRRR